jgi:hypothetical protein
MPDVIGDRSVSLEDIERVAVVATKEAYTIGCGRYSVTRTTFGLGSGSSPLTMFGDESVSISVYSATVTVYEPRTGKIQATRTFVGKPMACPDRFSSSPPSSEPDAKAIDAYVASFVSESF